MKANKPMLITYDELNKYLGMIGGLDGLLAMAPAIGLQLSGEASEQARLMKTEGTPVDITVNVHGKGTWTVSIRAAADGSDAG